MRRLCIGLLIVLFGWYGFTIDYNKTLHVAHVATTSNWETWIIVDNAGNSENPFKIILYDISGIEVFSQEYVIGVGESQFIQLTQGHTGIIEYYGANMFFRASYVETMEGGIAEFLLDDQSSLEIDFNLPQYVNEKLDWMGIALMNPGETLGSCHLEAIDINGNIIDIADIDVDQHTQAVGQIYDFFPDIDYTNLARISVDSDQPICGITISGQGTSKLLFTKASIRNIQPNELFIPHIASQFNSWENMLICDNSDSQSANVRLILYSGGVEVVDESVEINGNSNYLIYLNDYSDLNVDCGKIMDVPPSLIVRVSYLYKATDSTAEFLLTNTSKEAIVYNFPDYAQDNLTWMGLAVFNPSDNGVTLNLSAIKGGDEVDSVSLPLNGFSKMADTLESIFPDSFENGIDRVIVTSDTPVTGINISGAQLDRLLFTLSEEFLFVPEMVEIPSGSFMMGSEPENGKQNEDPVRFVMIYRFGLSKAEVSHAEFVDFLNKVPSVENGWFADKSQKSQSHIIYNGSSYSVESGYEKHPVIEVTYAGAVAYCNWISELYGETFYLPSEAEWEYSCRAGSTTDYYWGDTMDGSYCWYEANSDGDTHPVGTRQSNHFGLYDMSGNVWEWCADSYSETAYSETGAYVLNPSGNPVYLEPQANNVLRGGSYSNPLEKCRSAKRGNNNPVIMFNNVGFRLAKVMNEEDLNKMSGTVVVSSESDLMRSSEKEKVGYRNLFSK